MILGIFITAAILAISLWVVMMLIWWQKERGTTEALAVETTYTYLEKCARLSRRGWYICLLYARNAGSWLNKKIAKIFFSLFPSAVPAFTKKDELTGLSHGPSSFFLMSISESGKRKAKKSTLQNKIV